MPALPGRKLRHYSMKNMPVMDSKTAESLGFDPLTIGYQLPRELSMLAKTLDDLRRGRIKYCLVDVDDGIAVWRSTRTTTIAVPRRTCRQAIGGKMSRLTSAATKGKRP